MSIVGTLPVNLANGTLADATQVMSDFNFISAQVNANAAALAGGNNFSGVQQISGDTIATLTAAQTLSNKTLTSVVSMATTGVVVIGGNSLTVDPATGTAAIAIVRPTTNDQATLNLLTSGGATWQIFMAGTVNDLAISNSAFGSNVISFAQATGLVTVTNSLAVNGTATLARLAVGATQPAINVQRITSSQTISSSTGTAVIFNSENLDQGTNYAIGTGLFTAPAAGIYTFQAGATLQNNSASATGTTAFYFSRNAATAVGANRFDLPNPFPTGTNAGSNAFVVGGSVTTRLAINDTIAVRMDISGAGTITVSIGAYFSAYLQG